MRWQRETGWISCFRGDAFTAITGSTPTSCCVKRLKRGAARQHGHGPHQLPTVGRSIVREVGPRARRTSASVIRTRPVAVRISVVSMPVSVSYRWRASSSPSGVTLNCTPLA